MKETSQSAPDSSTISSVDLCGITNLTDRWHRKLAGAGYFPPPYKGYYQTGKTLVGIIKYQREQLLKKNDVLRKEEEGLKRAKRELAEHELAQSREEFIPKSIICPALRNLALNQRAVLQRKLEQEIGPNLAGLTTPEIMTRMRAAVDEILAVMREGTKSWMEAPPKD